MFLAFIFILSKAMGQDDVLKVPMQDIPNSEAFISWNQKSATAKDEAIRSFQNIKQIPFQCEKKILIPYQPKQSSKRYHFSETGKYDHFKLKATDAACMIPSPPNSSGQSMCLSASLLQHVILSDIYQDHCGHLYRGFQRRLYLKKNENNDTLVAFGKSLVKSHNRDGLVMFHSGNTSEVALEKFLFLGEVSDEERKTEEFEKDQLDGSYEVLNKNMTFRLLRKPIN